MIRNIIEIDEEKCTGCGECIVSCAESALQIIDGKAKLVKDIYCDGLGACLGACPTGALKIVQREAKEFDEHAVEQHLRTRTRTAAAKEPDLPCGCPGTLVREFGKKAAAPKCEPAPPAEKQESELTNWPVQLMLVPVNASYFQHADLLIAADCTAFSSGGFHGTFLKGKKLIIACPKLDDASHYVEKLTQIFAGNEIKSVSILRMEVPCCSGLTRIVRDALHRSGKSIPCSETIIGIKGERK